MRAWRNFNTFLSIYKYRCKNRRFPCDIYLLERFAIWRFQTSGNGGKSIAAEISGINAMLHHHGYGLNLHHGNTDHLKRIYRGINNLRKIYKIGRRMVYRRAMSIKMLNKMLIHLPLDDPFKRVLRSVLLYDQATGFRSHNVVLTKKGGYGRLRNIRFYPDVDNPTHLLAFLPYAKTHGVGDPQPESRTIKCVCSKGDLCAVHEVAALVRKRYKSGRHRNRAIFLLPDGSPVEYKHLYGILRALCILFSLDAAYYTPHCLRIGRATDMHMDRIPLPRIMKFMGWTSRKSAMKYIRPDNPDFVFFGID